MTMNNLSLISGLCAVVSLSACAPQLETPKLDETAIKVEIQETLARQDAAWNRGDIDGFMEDYLKEESLRFASGGNINRGWQATIDGYKARYPDKEAMGTLSFTDLEIDVFSSKDAMVFGHWKLQRAEDMPGGLFTLHMQNHDGRWIIVSDHTSSASP